MRWLWPLPVALAAACTDVPLERFESPADFVARAAIGDVYNCQEPGTPRVFLRLGAIDSFADGTPVYSVQVVPEFEALPLVFHAPFLAESFAFCATDPGARVPFDAEAFNEGYAIWQEAEGGVFTISAPRIYEVLFEILLEEQERQAERAT